MALTTFTAGQSITAGDAVTLTASGFLLKANAIEARSARVVGFAINTAATGDYVLVNNDAYFSTLSGLTPGESVYLSPFVSGAIVPSYAVLASGLQATSLESVYLTNVGRAATTSGLDVEISKPFFLNVTGGYLLMEGSSIMPGFILAEDGTTIDLEG